MSGFLLCRWVFLLMMTLLVLMLGVSFLLKGSIFLMFFGKVKAASNPYTTFIVLRRLAVSRSVKVRAAVAGNPNTQAHTIEELCLDPNVKVRMGVVGNPNITSKAWALLHKDESVRETLLASVPVQPAVKSHRS